MENRPVIKTVKIYSAVIPVILLIPLTVCALSLPALFADAGWVKHIATATAVFAAVNPGSFLLLFPIWLRLIKIKDRFIVREAVAVEGAGEETLNRCAAIAEARSEHPLAVCLRGYCGDIAAPPDKYIEMPGLGVSAQFSGQMIHAGSSEYLKGLNVEVPDVAGKAVHVALENRAIGYYRFYTPSDMRRMSNSIFRGIVLFCAVRIAVWTLFALTGTTYLAYASAAEIIAFVLSLIMMQRALTE